MDLAGKKVTVFGMGRSGFSALKLVHQKKADAFAVNIGNVESWPNSQEIVDLIGTTNCISQDDSSSCFIESDLIVLSPGIARTHPALKAAMSKGVPIWSEIELGYRYLPDIPIVAVTGTNGKTTTVTMIGEVVKNSGKRGFVGGNIGTPLCDMILDNQDYDCVVLELSSFQLESMISFKPDVAVVLNIFANHGERYSSVEQYFESKTHIVDYMDSQGQLIYSSQFELIDKWASQTGLSLVPVKTDDEKFLRDKLEKRYSLSKFKLPGAHNISNLFFVAKVAELIGATSGMQQMIDTFCGVPHRVQYIENDYTFIAYNDAKSTNWDATKTAVNAIEKGNKDLYLILGGQKRGRADSILPHLDFLKSRVDCFLLIGDTMDMFARELEGKAVYHKLESLEKTVNYLAQQKFDGTVLLSPAFPSYDQYKNYIVRGEHFCQLLSGLDSN